MEYMAIKKGTGAGWRLTPRGKKIKGKGSIIKEVKGKKDEELVRIRQLEYAIGTYMTEFTDAIESHTMLKYNALIRS